MKKIKHNDLTHYFLRDHKDLPPAYVKSCQEFFDSLKPQASSNKSQAASVKLAIEETQSETIKNLESIINEIK
jgi:hypothetical protein